MKRLTCEMCGSTELIKEDGVFVCQACGTKYSVEEAKKMMIEGAVEVAGTVKVDQSHLIDNFLNMAKSSLASANHSEAEQYCNRVIEIEPNNYQALLYKGTASAWQSTFAKIRIIETINCWKKALDNCGDSNKKDLLSYTDAEFKRIVVAMVNLAGSFVETGSSDYKVKSYKEHMLSILKCVELYVASINFAFRGADICSEAAISVIPSLMKCAQAEEDSYNKHKPSGGESYKRFIEDFIGCIDLLNITATFGQKDEAKALCYEKAAEVLQRINVLPFYIWSGTNRRYEAYQNTKNIYGSNVAEYKAKAIEARARIAKRIAEEKRKNREEFWAANKEEYNFLTEELSKSETERDKLVNAKTGYSKVSLLNEHISTIGTILSKDREAGGGISQNEKAFIKKCAAFWENLYANEGYDSYLDENPILKQASEFTTKRTQLLSQKQQIENSNQTKKPEGLIPSSVVAALGVITLLIGILGEMVFFIVFGALEVVGGGIASYIFLQQYANDKSEALTMKQTYIKNVLEYNAIIDKMLAVPKYTGTVSSDVAINIPEKIKTDEDMYKAECEATKEKRAKGGKKALVITVIAAIAVITAIIFAISIAVNSAKANSQEKLREELMGQIIIRYDDDDSLNSNFYYRYYARFNDDGTVSFGSDSRYKWDDDDEWEDPSEIYFSDSSTYSYSIEGWYSDASIVVKYKGYSGYIYDREYRLYKDDNGEYRMREIA